MGVTPSYLSCVAKGRKPLTRRMRENIAAVLGEALPGRFVYRQGVVVSG